MSEGNAEHPVRVASKKMKQVCRWIGADEALANLASFEESTQSAGHIKPLHWYIACRLVLEGGFRPDEVSPHPPFRLIERKGKAPQLVFDPAAASGRERTILGGLKTKNVDVVVTKEGIGPVLAVSCKAMTGALRNLTNRMEETIGECTNLHITYPALVFGYVFAVVAHREAEHAAELAGSAIGASAEGAPAREIATNDLALRAGGEPVESLIRFHAALTELTGRHGVREDVSRYEAITLMMVEASGRDRGRLVAEFPPPESRLRLETFFQTLYQRYEERFVYGAPLLKPVTERRGWDAAAPLFAADSEIARPVLDYDIRFALPGEHQTAVRDELAATSS